MIGPSRVPPARESRKELKRKTWVWFLQRQHSGIWQNWNSFVVFASSTTVIRQCPPRLKVPLYNPSSSFLPVLASQASIGIPYFC